MGIAVLYPTELLDDNGKKKPYTDETYEQQWTAVTKFKNGSGSAQQAKGPQ
jgi:hypothetical protein